MQGPADAGDARRRILLVIAGLPAGGAERQMALLARGIDRSRFMPGLLIFNREDRVHYRDALTDDLWFRALGLSGKSALRLAPALLTGIASAVRDFAPEIVHSSLNVANHTVRASALLYRWHAPIITSVRNDFTTGYGAREKFAERLLWRRSAAITCNADRVRNQIVAALPVPPDRVVTIPNGIDEHFFSDTCSPPPPWWPEGRVALCIGRFTDQKNPLGLIGAFAAIAADAAIADWRLVFVGEGPQREAMLEAVGAAGLSGRIVIRSPERDVAALYRAAGAVILPSRFEGMSNVCLEAAASGTPLAVSRGADAGALIEAGGAWLIEDDPDAMAESLRAVLQIPDATRADAGRRARLHVRARHSVEKMVGETMTLYDRLGKNA